MRSINITTQKLASGAQADLYLVDGKALKLFRPGYDESSVRYEFKLQQMASETGLFVPCAYEIVSSGDRIGIIMDYISGELLGNLAKVDIQNAAYYIGLSIDTHIKLHSYPGTGFPSQRERLMRRIESADALSLSQKAALMLIIEKNYNEESLCHGDFHALNVIKADRGMAVIDWVDATRGSRAADVCRSYLLYYFAANEVARPYVTTYCEKTGLCADDVYAWLPVMAAARLSENIEPNDAEILLDIVKNTLRQNIATPLRAP